MLDKCPRLSTPVKFMLPLVLDFFEPLPADAVLAVFSGILISQRTNAGVFEESVEQVQVILRNGNFIWPDSAYCSRWQFRI